VVPVKGHDFGLRPKRYAPFDRRHGGRLADTIIVKQLGLTISSSNLNVRTASLRLHLSLMVGNTIRIAKCLLKSALNAVIRSQLKGQLKSSVLIVVGLVIINGATGLTRLCGILQCGWDQ